MTTQLIVRMDKEKKERFERLARKRGMTVSEVIREFVDDYTKRHDMTGYLGKLIDEIGEDFKRQGITLEDIEKTIREVREEERKSREGRH